MRYSMITALCLASTALGGAPAFAQVAATDDSIGEIIVTAQRRTENVLKVPVSVTVVSAEQLRENGVARLQDISRLAPSLQTTEADNFSVRGVGTAAFFGSVESSVSQAIDEVVIGSRQLSGNGFYDVARVEVLNGPQGLLFGKNASAGLVSITTTRPQLGVTNGYMNAEGTMRYRPGGDSLGISVDGALNIPVGESSAIRIAGLYSHQDPLVRVIATGSGRQDHALDQVGGRLKYLYEPTSNFSLYVIGDYFESRGVNGEFDGTYRSLGAGSQYADILAAYNVTPSPTNFVALSDGENYRSRKSGGIQAKLSYTFDSGIEVSNIAAWKKYHLEFQADSDNTPLDFFNRNYNDSTYRQFSEELRIAFPAENRLSGQAGLYYFTSHLNDTEGRGGNNGLPAFLLPTFPFCVGAVATAGPPPACNVSNASFLGQDAHYVNDVESVAGFAQASYKVTDAFKLTAGGRVTHDSVKMDNLENVGSYFITLGVPNKRSIEKVGNTNFSWKIGADWQVNPGTLLYAFYGHGYKGPGFSATAGAPNAALAVRPEISRGGEIGLKSSFFDHKASLTISAFYTKFSDLQVSAFDPALRTVILGNAAKATTKGLDVMLAVRPVAGLSLSAAANYTDATYDSYPGAQCYFGQTTPGCATTNSFDAAGEALLQSAKFTSRLSADYEFPVTGNLQGVVNAGYFHRSSLRINSFDPASAIQPWDTLDLGLGVKTAKWQLTVFCRNCTNEIRPLAIQTEPGDGLIGVKSYLQKIGFNSMRTIGLRFGLNY